MKHGTGQTLVAALVLTGLVALGGHSASAQQVKVIAEGAEDYAAHCAACHGTTGRGDGELAARLAIPPSDLTQISESAERFPFWRVYTIIAGEVAVPGHDSFQMPQFIERLKADEPKPGYLPAHIRILLLTHYLESLQAP